jgi:hypothetical protein
MSVKPNLSRQAMHSYCEPYFHAIKEWMKYDNEKIFKNRLQLLNTLVKILNDHNPDDDYDLEVENTDISLLPLVGPTAGNVYLPGI